MRGWNWTVERAVLLHRSRAVTSQAPKVGPGDSIKEAGGNGVIADIENGRESHQDACPVPFLIPRGTKPVQSRFESGS